MNTRGQEIMNSTQFSPRVTRSKVKQKQTTEIASIKDTREKKNSGEKAVNIGKNKRRKQSKALMELNSVIANKGSTGSLSNFHTPKKCNKMKQIINLSEDKPIIHNSPRINSPCLGTISADTPERKSRFYNFIENISDSSLRILGKGSFGTIIQATYKGNLVAAKIVSPDRINTLKNELNNFFLSHANIVRTIRIISNEEYNSFGLVIMEMCSSLTLEHIVTDESYTITDHSIKSFMRDICQALDHCHKQRVLHLDVKPKNILVNISANVCKLCDFGSSCLLMEDDLCAPEADFRTLLNTIIYASPELLTGGPPTEKSDVYSLGITLWQVVYREKPYDNDNFDLQSTIHKIVKQKKRPQRKFKKSECFEKLYTQCWNHNPQKRPKIEEVIQYLEDIGGQ